MVLHHVQFTVSSLPAAKSFYLAALAPLGYSEYYATDTVVGLGVPGAPDLWLGAAKPGGAPSAGLHLAFAAASREVVDQFYDAALTAGAKDNGPPGVRSYVPGYYAAYVLDLDGNNIEVVHV